jgi:hypothetical protein
MLLFKTVAANRKRRINSKKSAGVRIKSDSTGDVSEFVKVMESVRKLDCWPSPPSCASLGLPLSQVGRGRL